MRKNNSEIIRVGYFNARQKFIKINNFLYRFQNFKASKNYGIFLKTKNNQKISSIYNFSNRVYNYSNNYNHQLFIMGEYTNKGGADRKLRLLSDFLSKLDKDELSFIDDFGIFKIQELESKTPTVDLIMTYLSPFSSNNQVIRYRDKDFSDEEYDLFSQIFNLNRKTLYSQGFSIGGEIYEVPAELTKYGKKYYKEQFCPTFYSQINKSNFIKDIVSGKDNISQLFSYELEEMADFVKNVFELESKRYGLEFKIASSRVIISSKGLNLEFVYDLTDNENSFYISNKSYSGIRSTTPNLGNIRKEVDEFFEFLESNIHLFDNLKTEYRKLNKKAKLSPYTLYRMFKIYYPEFIPEQYKDLTPQEFNI